MLAYILVAFAFCFALERAVPGWKLPKVRTWPLRVLLVNAVQLGVVLLAGVSWERWARGRSLLHVSEHVGPLAGGLLAYFVATFVFYWWHRWRHESDFLWLHFHQIHHSPFPKLRIGPDRGAHLLMLEQRFKSMNGLLSRA